MLFQGFQPLVQGLDADEINQLSLEIIQTLQGEGGALELLLTHLADLTNALADKDQVIGDVIDNLSSVLNAVGERDTELSQPDHPAAATSSAGWPATAPRSATRSTASTTWPPRPPAC